MARRANCFQATCLKRRKMNRTKSEEFNPVVVAEKTATLRRFPVSQAVLDLDMTGAPVLVFRNAATDRVNIVYRRSDGNIGWIDPASPDGRTGSH